MKSIQECVARKAEKWQQEGKTGFDCADDALTALAECASAEGQPLTIPVYDASSHKYVDIRSADYSSVDGFAKALRDKMGAVSLFDSDKVTVAIGKASDTPEANLGLLERGNLVIYDLRDHHSSEYTGHTMVIVENRPNQKQIQKTRERNKSA
jgi:hypothetical protein